MLETVRECLQDVYDLPALKDIAASVERRELRIVETTTQQPSPFAKSLLFGYVAQFLYEGDSPPWRNVGLRPSPSTPRSSTNSWAAWNCANSWTPPSSIQQSWNCSALPRTDVRGMEGVADLLRLLGPLSVEEVAQRLQGVEQAEVEGADHFDEAQAAAPHGSVADAGSHLAALQKANRALKVTIGGVERFAAIEDAARLRDAIGVPLPMGVPLAFIEPVHDPLGDLVSRYARTHGPFTAAEAAARLGLGVAVSILPLSAWPVMVGWWKANSAHTPFQSNRWRQPTQSS